MDSLVYPGTKRLDINSCSYSPDPRFIDLNAQNETYQRHLFDWMERNNDGNHVKQRDQPVYGEYNVRDLSV